MKTAFFEDRIAKSGVPGNDLQCRLKRTPRFLISAKTNFSSEVFLLFTAAIIRLRTSLETISMSRIYSRPRQKQIPPSFLVSGWRGADRSQRSPGAAALRFFRVRTLASFILPYWRVAQTKVLRGFRLPHTLGSACAGLESTSSTTVGGYSETVSRGCMEVTGCSSFQPCSAS